ncbi:hypothetical protein BN946_scf184888.g11 [Trametes cinnabarina]|uniref:Uncharacterized protein n=1 Tax=Pycnoporus cinnabarinus TaxID=5643 RepID=A0A060SP69_PYCCI|nr:hypothetical protein BN946_scf184888.g11 [Trametes cinnabarina]
MNPLRNPFASPSSSHSSLASLDDSLWDCDLLKPPSRATSTASSLPALSFHPVDLRVASLSRDPRQRLMSLPNFTTEPSSTSPPQEAAASYYVPFPPSTPAKPHPTPAPTHPAPPRAGTSVLSPLTPTHVPQKSRFLSSQSSPLPSMSFVAPVPRLPLADALRHLDASWAPRTPDGSVHARAAKPNLASPRDGEQPQLGLGLSLGSAGLPILLPRPHLELDAMSESPSEYSRRLRNIAPAPLRLASTTPRTSLRAIAQPHTPLTSPRRRTLLSSVFVDVPLDTQHRDVFQFHFSVSPRSDRRASMASTLTSHSTAPTSPDHGRDLENAHPKRGANPPTYIDGLSSRRHSSWASGSPLSPLAAKYGPSGPSNLGKLSYTPGTPRTPTRRESIGPTTPFTPRLPTDTPPPRLRRTEWVPLPELADEETASPDLQVLSPLRADLRLDLGVEDLSLRAEKCSETIARASLYLCSCSLLREPDSIVNLCEKLRATFAVVQRALDGTPSEFTADDSDAKRTWYAKHWQIVSSLDRNLNLFYLLAHQLEERPPRIHRLAPTLDKLSTYQAKFADLARRIATIEWPMTRILDERIWDGSDDDNGRDRYAS